MCIQFQQEIKANTSEKRGSKQYIGHILGNLSFLLQLIVKVTQLGVFQDGTLGEVGEIVQRTKHSHISLKIEISGIRITLFKYAINGRVREGWHPICQDGGVPTLEEHAQFPPQVPHCLLLLLP